MKKLKINNDWFFSDVPAWSKILQIYIKGDSLVLIPFLILMLLIGFFDLKFMAVCLAVFYMLRQIGEMVYWLMQQFSQRKYRPYDYGYKNLDNHAIYIIYQLRCLVGATIGACTIIYLLFFLN